MSTQVMLEPVIENEAGELTHCSQRVYWTDCARHAEDCFVFHCVSCSLEVSDCNDDYVMVSHFQEEK